MATISNNSGAFGRKSSPSTQQLVDDIAGSPVPEGSEEVVETVATMDDAVKPCCHKLDTKEVVVVALAAIAAWEIIKSIFKN